MNIDYSDLAYNEDENEDNNESIIKKDNKKK